jgi:hypothetical protein
LDAELLKNHPDRNIHKLHQFCDQMEVILLIGQHEIGAIPNVKDFTRIVTKGEPPEKFINALEQIWLEHT